MRVNRLQAEEERIRQAYERRDHSGKSSLYAWHRHDVAYSECRKRIIWGQAFKRFGLINLDTLEIVDVGCGTGGWLRMLLEWGAAPSRLHGLDLLPDRIGQAKALSPPTIDFQVNNGWPLPYVDGTMDLCAASTVFSSILDAEARKALAEEMVRVAAHKSLIMVFDYVISDPRNPDTIGISGREILRLFPLLRLVKTYRLILAPPILRRIPTIFLWLAHAIEVFFPFLCTHRLYTLRKV